MLNSFWFWRGGEIEGERREVRVERKEVMAKKEVEEQEIRR